MHRGEQAKTSSSNSDAGGQLFLCRGRRDQPFRISPGPQRRLPAGLAGHNMIDFFFAHAFRQDRRDFSGERESRADLRGLFFPTGPLDPLDGFKKEKGFREACLSLPGVTALALGERERGCKGPGARRRPWLVTTGQAVLQRQAGKTPLSQGQPSGGPWQDSPHLGGQGLEPSSLGYPTKPLVRLDCMRGGKGTIPWRGVAATGEK